MKNIKKILACVLALVMCVSVFVCTPALAVTDERTESFSTFRSDLVVPQDQRDNLNQYIEFRLTPSHPGGVTTLTAYMHNNGKLVDEEGNILKENNVWGILMDIDYGDLIPVEGTTDKYGRTFPKWTKGNPYNSKENFNQNAYISPLKLDGEENPNLKEGRLTYGFHYEYPKCRLSGQMFTIDFLVPETVTENTDLTVKVDESTFSNTSVVQCLDHTDAKGNNAKAIGNNFSFVSATVAVDYVQTPVATAKQTAKDAITVSWNDCFNADSYTVYRMDSQTEELQVIASGVKDTKYVDTAVTKSDSYTYVVEAKNDSLGTTATSEFCTVDFFGSQESPVISVYGAPGVISLEIEKTIYMQDGIEVAYSKVKDMSEATVLEVLGEETVDFEVEQDVVYYVSARSYKTIDGTTYYSAFSDVQTVYSSNATYIDSAYMYADGTVDLSWTGVKGVTSYVVKVLDKDGTEISSTTVEGTSVTLGGDNGIVLGTGQMFVVEAGGVVSAPAQGIVCPPQIKEIRNTSTNAVELVFDVDLQNTYTVLRSVNGSEFEQIEVQVWDNALVDESAKVDGVYSYQVKEYSKELEKESEYCNPVSITLLADDSVVSDLEAKQTDINTVYITWLSLENAQSYTVSRSVDGVAFETLKAGIESTEFVDTTATENKTYYYQVTATNGNFTTGAKQVEIEVDNVCPTVPQLTVKQTALGKVELSWQTLENAGVVLISRWTEQEGWQQIDKFDGTEVSYKDTGLTGQKYIYSVTAYGEKSYQVSTSKQVEFTVDNSCPTKPSVTVKQTAIGQVQLSWQTLKGATKVEVLRKTQSGSWKTVAKLGATARSFKDKGLSQQKYSYTVKVYGKNSYQVSTSKEVSISVVNKKLSTVKISSVKYSKKNEVKISYKKVSGADYYELYRRIGTKGSYKKIKKVSSKYAYIVDKTAKSAGTYYYKVKAVDKKTYLSGSASSAKSIKVMSFSQKAKFSLSAAKKAFTFKFKSKVTNADGYQVQYATKSNFKGAKTVTVSKSAKSKKISKLKAKTTYYVRVRAYKTIGGKKVYGAYSGKLKIKTKK